MANKLLTLLGADNGKSYSGYFLMYVPTDLKYLNMYKGQDNIGVKILGFNPDEEGLRKSFGAIVAKR